MRLAIILFVLCCVAILGQCPVTYYAPQKTRFIFDGDSFTENAPYVTQILAKSRWTGLLSSTNYAVSGSSPFGSESFTNLAGKQYNILRRFETNILPWVASGDTNIIVICTVGANGMGSYGMYAPTYFSNVNYYVNQCHSNNMRVLLFTVPQRADALTEQRETNRLNYNAMLMADTNRDYVVDLATLLPDCFDRTYFEADGIHPGGTNGQGEVVIAEAVHSALTYGDYLTNGYSPQRLGRWKGVTP